MGILILILSFAAIMLNMSPSPLKLSLFLTYLSIVLSLISYKITSSVFTSTVVMISFSSGMMILFSYCSVLCTYKEKSFLKKPMTTTLMALLVLPMITSTPQLSMSTSVKTSFISVTNTNYLIFLMMLVIVAMVGINTSFFNPAKKFMMSY